MRTLLRAALVATAAIVTLVLELSVAPRLHLPYAVPDLVVLAVFAFAAQWGAAAGASAGFAIGLVQDLAPPGLGALGRNALVLTVVGALAGRVGREVHRSALRTSALAGSLAALAMVLDLLIGLALGGGVGLSPAGVPRALGACALYTAVATPLIVPGLAALARRTDGPGARLLAPPGSAFGVPVPTRSGPAEPAPGESASAESASAQSAPAGSESERV
ncbi:rod shape-determining protein MreD [Actinocrinis puniceicyclus]|uniref:Rod shape-determining protein MreD n=1 Tax=Actinocrinis puniceicyclus TaxID=977794 RepID=A0A8J7WL27_9ACTN|nr:rod shape-determining protein MreD [Actinocrinis puniceicyclus]MBS2961697.1 rod shape-determining protein MreD [Actinocrinis puniceicyclus]